MWAYIQIARPDHWIKNVFVLPGIVLSYFFLPDLWSWHVLPRLALALVAVCLTASSNYVLNELLDAEHDRHHPVKKYRPIPSGAINHRIAIVEWLLVGAAGMAAGFAVNAPLGWLCVFLWFMGTLYNIPPVRLKDIPYADVLSESINNPIRMAMGWYATGVGFAPPASILLAYWMFGAFLMAIKRFAEYRSINDPALAAAYRKSFRFYTDQRLLESILYYAVLFAMFAGVFIARYQMELILATPIVVYTMSYYLHIGYKPQSAAQYPERLYKAHKLIWLVSLAFVVLSVLLLVEIPGFDEMFTPYVLPPNARP